MVLGKNTEQNCFEMFCVCPSLLESFFEPHSEQLPYYSVYIYRLLSTVVTIHFEVTLSGSRADERKSCSRSSWVWGMVKQRGILGNGTKQVFKEPFLSLLKGSFLATHGPAKSLDSQAFYLEQHEWFVSE